MSEYALLDASGTLLRTQAHETRPADPVGKGWRWLPLIRRTGTGGSFEDGDSYVIETPEPAPVVPIEVGRVQAKIWLHRAGKLVAVEAYIAAAEDAELTLWWNEANYFRRDNPHVVALAAGFDIDLDVAFTEAAQIT
jgi:hypothetical protein